jgi:hypothetical protein
LQLIHITMVSRMGAEILINKGDLFMKKKEVVLAVIVGLLIGCSFLVFGR